MFLFFVEKNSEFEFTCSLLCGSSLEGTLRKHYVILFLEIHSSQLRNNKKEVFINLRNRVFVCALKLSIYSKMGSDINEQGNYGVHNDQCQWQGVQTLGSRSGA